METPIENISTQSKVPVTQPAMTAKNLEAFEKSKEANSVSAVQAQTETPISDPEGHQVDIAI